MCSTVVHSLVGVKPTNGVKSRSVMGSYNFNVLLVQWSGQAGDEGSGAKLLLYVTDNQDRSSHFANVPVLRVGCATV